MSMLTTLHSWKLPTLGLIGLLFALITVWSLQTTPMQQPVISPPVSPYLESVAGIGVIEPKSEIISIGTELPGVVREVKVKVGDFVNADDPLFILDQRDIDAQILTLQAALLAAKIQAKDANAQYALVKGAQDGRAVARDDYNHRSYNAELMAAKVDEALAKLNLAKTTKDRLTVRAPINGQILNINVRKGEFAEAGYLSEPLMRIGDMSTRHVRVEIDEENARLITPNSVAKGFKRADPDHAIHLTFVRFEPYVRPKQNLAVAGQHVDTRVLQIIYALSDTKAPPFVGEQMDVFIQNPNGKQP